MILSAVLQVAAFLLVNCGGHPPAVAQSCPRATLTCQRNPSNRSEYACAVLAQYPSERNAPRYAWAVSEGSIRGDRNSPNVTVEVGGVKAETLTVTAEVRWRGMPRACDVSLSEKLASR